MDAIREQKEKGGTRLGRLNFFLFANELQAGPDAAFCCLGRRRGDFDAADGRYMAPKMRMLPAGGGLEKKEPFYLKK